jgi:hypothetical protein
LAYDLGFFDLFMVVGEHDIARRHGSNALKWNDSSRSTSMADNAIDLARPIPRSAHGGLDWAGDSITSARFFPPPAASPCFPGAPGNMRFFF